MEASNKAQKNRVDYLLAYSLNDLIDQINKYNTEFYTTPILKEDIVEIFKDTDGAYFLLYYK